MSMGMRAARSQLCLKRLLDEPQDNLLKCKVARLDPHPPATGLSNCLRPRSPAPESNQSQSPSRVGSYLLFERCEGEKTYRAVHADTKEQYTCQVELLNVTHTVYTAKILQKYCKYFCKYFILLILVILVITAKNTSQTPGNTDIHDITKKVLLLKKILEILLILLLLLLLVILVILLKYS